jgi:hypothetical protein
MARAHEEWTSICFEKILKFWWLKFCGDKKLLAFCCSGSSTSCRYLPTCQRVDDTEVWHTSGTEWKRSVSVRVGKVTKAKNGGNVNTCKKSIRCSWKQASVSKSRAIKQFHRFRTNCKTESATNSARTHTTYTSTKAMHAVTWAHPTRQKSCCMLRSIDW